MEKFHGHCRTQEPTGLEQIRLPQTLQNREHAHQWCQRPAWFRSPKNSLLLFLEGMKKQSTRVVVPGIRSFV